MRQPFVFADRPLRVYWETTRSCDLACRHCRAEAAPDADPNELTSDEGRRLLQRLLAFGDPAPHVVFTGGDPLKRRDLFELIDYARAIGLHVSVAPSATPLLTEAALREMHDAGVDAISLSLDGSTGDRHDAIRGIPGTYHRTLIAARTAREIGLPFQVNTLVCGETVEDLPAIYEQVVAMGAARWSLFFLVSVGRGQVLQPVTAARAEAVLAWVAWLSSRPDRGSLVVTTTEAPQIRRVMSQRRRAAPTAGTPSFSPGPGGAASTGARPPQHGAGIRDGNGILFISHTGDICPSGFLEIATGNVRHDDVVSTYRTAPLFRQLRLPQAFAGRCGRCEFQIVCGGSRARAFSASGDPLSEDPLCTHQPAERRELAAVL
jgi:radical SAM protein